MNTGNVFPGSRSRHQALDHELLQAGSNVHAMIQYSALSLNMSFARWSSKQNLGLGLGQMANSLQAMLVPRIISDTSVQPPLPFLLHESKNITG
jgi:hypothetical protein